MSFDAFQSKLEKEIKRHFPNEVEVKFKEVEIGNGIFHTGMEIRDGRKDFVPVFDVEELYEETGDDENKIEAAAKELVSQYQEAANFGEKEFDVIKDLNKIEGSIYFQFINYEKNKDLLKEIPHKKWMDLAIVLYLYCEQGEESYLTLITKEQVEKWDTSERYLFEKAQENTPIKFPAQIQLLPEQTDDKLYVLTNEQMSRGAACLLYPDVLKQFAASQNGDVYIIPASVNEVILMKADGNLEEAEAVLAVLREKSVSAEDVLSDVVYLYKKDNNTINM